MRILWQVAGTHISTQSAYRMAPFLLQSCRLLHCRHQRQLQNWFPFLCPQLQSIDMYRIELRKPQAQISIQETSVDIHPLMCDDYCFFF